MFTETNANALFHLHHENLSHEQSDSTFKKHQIDFGHGGGLGIHLCGAALHL
jgi:hypothetical protein